MHPDIISILIFILRARGDETKTTPKAWAEVRILDLMSTLLPQGTSVRRTRKPIQLIHTDFCSLCKLCIHCCADKLSWLILSKGRSQKHSHQDPCMLSITVEIITNVLNIKDTFHGNFFFILKKLQSQLT